MRMKPFPIRCASAVAVTMLVAGCNGGFNPVRDVAAAVGAGPQTAASQDFVVQSRPTNLDYMPIGTAVQGRPTAARTADEIKAAEAELDALRARNEAAGAAAATLGNTPPPEPVKLPANTSQPTRQKTNSKRTP
ncbi:hypothetical protein [Microvirga lotononidis]|uniref:Beta-barrel assembly machine subunit BamF n=1 Tax=Microvirga lotononidis TaxID=864069 RepID=I4YY11_9HYPH|nr:hypothetical protein [Microvirga lotononidis]EIM28853.1 hypothetical protein MicloDRAFT_00024980 [Microvirga lotononidis]WQO26776.1 hypothetical protein U0023_19240 [Microvirga lotononidis]